VKTIEEKRAEQRERSIQLTMQTCRHFNGINHTRCEAGVDYNDVMPLPCIAFGNSTKSASCALKSCFTREDAEVKQIERDQSMAESLKAMRAAHDDAKEKGFIKGHGGQGSLKCPVCTDGTLRYSVASYNGHMHAGCSTRGCVSWME
jgi:hypothetical protein